MKSNPFSGRYLFHLHTVFTDGDLTVEDYFAFALRQRINTLVFLEHIRRQPAYDVFAFARLIRKEMEETGIRSLIGFEAKLLPECELDISEEAFQVAEVIGIAEHGFPDDPKLLDRSFRQTLDRLCSSSVRKTLVWVHPGLWFRKRGIEPSLNKNFVSMLNFALERRVRVEMNLRYGLILKKYLPKIPTELLVVGADAHSIEDLHSWAASE